MVKVKIAYHCRSCRFNVLDGSLLHFLPGYMLYDPEKNLILPLDTSKPLYYETNFYLSSVTLKTAF
uniref:Uncharacterized protein n=1 Tax=Rhizophora mucronata TaxID=61149 RepID=A0A2P2QCB9_RHIMU